MGVPGIDPPPRTAPATPPPRSFPGYPDGLVGDIERITAGVLSARELDGYVRGNYSADDIASAIADALLADLPILQLVEIVTDHPRPAALHITTAGGSGGLYRHIVRWNADGETSRDEEAASAVGDTLASTIDAALKYGTPARPKP